MTRPAALAAALSFVRSTVVTGWLVAPLPALAPLAPPTGVRTSTGALSFSLTSDAQPATNSDAMATRPASLEDIIMGGAPAESGKSRRERSETVVQVQCPVGHTGTPGQLNGPHIGSRTSDVVRIGLPLNPSRVVVISTSRP